MEQRRKLSRAERLGNLVVKVLLRLGVAPKQMYLLTVRGRKTGRSYSTPLTVVEVEGQRWLVAPYAGAAWAKNVAASGSAKLSRGRVAEQLAVEPATVHESAPVLKAYVGIAPMTRSAFGVGPEASLEEFEAVASKHPVFRIRPVQPPGPGASE